MYAIRNDFLTAAASLCLTLTANASPMDLVGPISNYKIFVAKHVDRLVEQTAAFTAAVKGG